MEFRQTGLSLVIPVRLPTLWHNYQIGESSISQVEEELEIESDMEE